MAEQDFRIAFKGFNREDVVHYLEYLNNRHASQLSQLKAETDALRRELEVARLASISDNSLTTELEAARARCAELETELAAWKNAQSASSAVPQPAPQAVPQLAETSDELAAYRRAERVERMANRRAAEIRDRANAALADAAAHIDAANAALETTAAETTEQIRLMQDAVEAGKATLRDAADALAAIGVATEAE